MEFIGTITEVSTPKCGTTENGAYKVSVVKIKDFTQMYGQSVMADAWDAMCDMAMNHLGQNVRVMLDIRIREAHNKDGEPFLVNNVRIMRIIPL